MVYVRPSRRVRPAIRTDPDADASGREKENSHIKALIDDTKSFTSQAELDSNLEVKEPKLFKRYKKTKERNPSMLYDFFYGFLKSINVCNICKYTDVTYQPFSLITLDLTTEDKKEIRDLYQLIAYSEREKNSGMLCECGII